MLLLPKLTKAKFIRRLNRFVAQIELDSQKIDFAHLANTGRMKELLIPGATVYLKKAGTAKRKTNWDLFLIESHSQLVCLKAVYANELVAYWLSNNELPIFNQFNCLQREVSVDGHRYDFLLKGNHSDTYLEVKSVNYVIEQVALFPDAPTSRGASHVEGLIDIKKSGADAAIIFVIMGQSIKELRFNRAHDPRFAEVMKQAKEAGLSILVCESLFTPYNVRLEAIHSVNWEES